VKGNKLLIAILAMLTASVLLTGGLAIHLTLALGDRESARTRGSVAAEPTATVEPAAAYIDPDEPHIAFVSDQEEALTVYVMDTDGSKRQQVSNPDQGFCLNPAWSPDGQRVAYVGMDEDAFQDDDGDSAIWVSTANGSEHVNVSHPISDVFGLSPTWSPDGTRVAFVAGTESLEESEPAEEDEPVSVIYITHADGSGIEQSIPLPCSPFDLTWSPAGEALLMVCEMTDDEEASVQILTSGENGEDEGEGGGWEITELLRGAQAADWSPDGDEVVVGDYTSNAILVVERDQDPRQVAETRLSPVEIAWSPDGAYLAVATAGYRRQGYANGLHLVALETGEITTVIENEGWVVQPSWSADGSQLLFTSGPMIRRRESNMPYANLWIYTVEPSGLEQLTLGGGFEGMGDWSP